MSIYTYINDLHLSVGESKRMNCPECNGYKTFSVTNNMGNLLWNCYKASCSVRGSSRVHMIVEEIRDINKVSQVGTSFEMPEYVANVDAIGTLRILESVKTLGLENKTKIYK